MFEFHILMERTGISPFSREEGAVSNSDCRQQAAAAKYVWSYGVIIIIVIIKYVWLLSLPRGGDGNLGLQEETTSHAYYLL